MEEVSEEVTTGSMSNFEYLLISAIIQQIYPNMEDWLDNESFDIVTIAEYFEATSKMAKILKFQFPIFKRSKSEIEKALKHYQSQFEIFYKLHT